MTRLIPREVEPRLQAKLSHKFGATMVFAGKGCWACDKSLPFR